MKRNYLIAFSLVMLLAILFSGSLRDLLVLNLSSLDAAHWTLNGHPFLAAWPDALKTSQACGARWMESFAAAAQGDLAARNQAYRHAAACDAKYVVFLHQMYQQDLEMAQMMLQAQPSSAESWFWVGDLETEKKLKYYQQGLMLDPRDGLRWITYGDLLVEKDPNAAIQAYLQACYNGDPGYHGCGKAGALAERMGDSQAAIQYFRLSSYPPIRQKADELEKAHP